MRQRLLCRPSGTGLPRPRYRLVPQPDSIASNWPNLNGPNHACFSLLLRSSSHNAVSQPRPARRLYRTAPRAGRRLQTLVRRRLGGRLPPPFGGIQHGHPNAVDPLAPAPDNAKRPPQQRLYREGRIASLEERRAPRIVHHVDVLRNVVVQRKPRPHLRDQHVSRCVIKVGHSSPQLAHLCRRQVFVSRIGVTEHPPNRGRTVLPWAARPKSPPNASGEVVFLSHGSDVGAVRLDSMSSVERGG